MAVAAAPAELVDEEAEVVWLPAVWLPVVTLPVVWLPAATLEVGVRSPVSVTTPAEDETDCVAAGASPGPPRVVVSWLISVSRAAETLTPLTAVVAAGLYCLVAKPQTFSSLLISVLSNHVSKGSLIV